MKTPETNPADLPAIDPLTNLQMLEERLHTVTAERDAAYAEMENLARFISHDLRAPLRGIDGYSKALMEDYHEKLDPVGMAYLQFIFEASHHASSLIDKLIYFIRAQHAEIHLQTIDMSQLARDLIKHLHDAQPERNINWLVAPDLSVRGDFGMIQELLKNLLENAWKFTSKQTAAHIEIGQIHTDDGAAFFVRDDGAGFNMDYVDRLFQPFQRVHSSHEFEGAGLGLAIVRRIIERHDGRIWAEGKVDQGATFYFTIKS
jgi:light-regulated signal transduction histidine kinase (bacteriophytochrome)